MGILGKFLYVSDTLFILYLEQNHTLFGDKLYFIWKFSSGNTDPSTIAKRSLRDLGGLKMKNIYALLNLLHIANTDM